MAGNGAADQQQLLLLQAKAGNARLVKATVAAGASVNGSPQQGRPLIAAAYRGHVSIVKLLAERGAQLEAAASDADQRDEQGNVRFPMSSTALHAAVYGVHLEAVRALLQAGANPNSIDVRGWTPLNVACTMFRAAPRYAIAAELLRAGADPAKVNFEGRLAIHCAASRGDSAVIQMLLAKAPETINHFGLSGLTPLCDAAREGHSDAVSFLLANGASEKEAVAQRGVCALMLAARNGHCRVVRLLLRHGLEAVGGVAAVPEAMKHATQLEHPRILWMLLGVEGPERRQHWATLRLRNWPPLYHAATVGSYCSVKVLLAAGADAAAVSAFGEKIEEVVGKALPASKKNAATMAAIGRMLRRGPALRARSWAWPGRQELSDDGGGCGGGGAYSRSRRPETPLGVRVFRPTGGTFFATRVTRYCGKKRGR